MIVIFKIDMRDLKFEINKLDWIKILDDSIKSRSTSWGKNPVIEWRNASDEICGALIRALTRKGLIEDINIEEIKQKLEHKLFVKAKWKGKWYQVLKMEADVAGNFFSKNIHTKLGIHSKETDKTGLKSWRKTKLPSKFMPDIVYTVPNNEIEEYRLGKIKDYSGD